MLEMARVSRMPSPFWRHSGTEASVSSQPRVSYRSPCRVTSGVVALDLTSVPMLVSDTVTNGFEFSVTRERFRPAGTSADRDCSRSSPASRCRKHFQYLNWSRALLSKSRYMCGRQCQKKLWQTVYDPEPVEEPLPGTVKGMGIEVGIKARLLWPGGVLVDTPYNDYAEAIRRTKALTADPTQCDQGRAGEEDREPALAEDGQAQIGRSAPVGG